MREVWRDCPAGSSAAQPTIPASAVALCGCAWSMCACVCTWRVACCMVVPMRGGAGNSRQSGVLGACPRHCPSPPPSLMHALVSGAGGRRASGGARRRAKGSACGRGGGRGRGRVCWGAKSALRTPSRAHAGPPVGPLARGGDARMGVDSTWTWDHGAMARAVGDESCGYTGVGEARAPPRATRPVTSCALRRAAVAAACRVPPVASAMVRSLSRS